MRNCLRYLGLALLLVYQVSVGAQDLSGEQKPFRFNGSIAAGGSYYKVSGLDINRQNPYGYYLSINATPSVYGLSLPFTIVLNEQGTRFGQPFNRFGISPNYKWATLHLGHRNLRFSEFTLNGVTMLGVGLELNPGKFRFAAAYGQLREPVNAPNGNFFQAQFARRAYSAKIGFGSRNNYFDLIFFRADDDTNSIRVSDSLSQAIEAANNTSVGIKSEFGFFKDHLTFDIDAATSLYTRDQRAPGFDNSDFPLGSLVDYLAPNISSNLAIAGKAGMQLNFTNWGLGLRYRLVQDQFRSLGTNYLIDDLEQYTINPRLSLFKGKLNLNGSYGLQFNNLSERRAFASSRNIGSVNLNWLASKVFTLAASYSNFAITQSVFRDQVFNDSLLIDQVNHNLNLSPFFTWQSETAFQSLNLNSNYQRLLDNNSFTAAFNENYLLNNQIGYTLSLLASQWTFSTGLNHNLFATESLSSSRYGGFAAVSKTLAKNKLDLSLNLSYNRNQQEGNNANIYNTNFSAQYRLGKKQSLQLSTYTLLTRGEQNFSELRMSFGYRVSF